MGTEDAVGGAASTKMRSSTRKLAKRLIAVTRIKYTKFMYL